MSNVFGKLRRFNKQVQVQRSRLASCLKLDKNLKFVAMSTDKRQPGENFKPPQNPASDRTVRYAPKNENSAGSKDVAARRDRQRNDRKEGSSSRDRSRSRENRNDTKMQQHEQGSYRGHDDHQRSFGRGRGKYQNDHPQYNFHHGQQQSRSNNWPQQNQNVYNQGQNVQYQGYQSNWSYNDGYGTQQRYYRGERDDDGLTFLSRTLSSILRHNAERFGFKLMKGGFLYVDEILHKVHKLHGFKVQDVQHVVKTNDKQRFALEQEDGRWKIRANQGHSIEVECLDLTPITNADEFPKVIHGTYYAAWDLIKKTGLRRMTRNHIHFAAGEPGSNGVISGMRSSCEVIIYLDLEKALKDGIKFYLSANNVILSEGDENGIIYPCYFQGVLDRKNRCRIEFDNTISASSCKNTESESKNKKKKKDKKKKHNAEGGNLNEDHDLEPDCCPEDGLDPFNENHEARSETQDDCQVIFQSENDDKFDDDTSIVNVNNGNTDASQEAVENAADHRQTVDEPIVGNTNAAVEGDPELCADKQSNSMLMAGSSQATKDKWDDDDVDNDDDDDQDEANTELLEWLCPEFMKVELSKDVIEKIITDKPKYVVVCCVGEELGKRENSISAIVVMCYPKVYVYHLSNIGTGIVKDGKLDQLLLDKDITKVFFNVGDVSRALIRDCDILLNSTPILDIELMFNKVKLANMDLELLKENYGFNGKFKKWREDNEKYGKLLADENIHEASLTEVITKGRCMAHLYEFCKEKLNPDTLRALKTEVYKLAIPTDENDDLTEKTAKLKQGQSGKKQKQAKKEAEVPEPDNTQQKKQGKGGKNKGGGGGGGGKQAKNRGGRKR